MDDKRRKEVGRIGESIAAEYLVRHGFTLIERNYWKPWGEIDIIAVKGKVVRFVEVKTVSRENIRANGSRETSSYRPEEQIHPAKLKKVVRTAELYMAEKGDEREYQIDAVGVELDMASRRAKCRLYEQIL